MAPGSSVRADRGDSEAPLRIPRTLQTRDCTAMASQMPQGESLPASTEELLRRPDWQLLLPVQMCKTDELTVSRLFDWLALKRFAAPEDRICPVCQCDLTAQHNPGDDANIRFDCNNGCQAVKFMITKDQELEVWEEVQVALRAPLQRKSALAFNQAPPTGPGAIADLACPVLRRLAQDPDATLLRLEDLSVDSEVSEAEDTDEVSAIPYLLSRPLSWNIKEMCSLRSLHIVGRTRISPLLSDLAEVISAQSTLHQVKIFAYDLWSIKKTRKIVELAKAFRFSNVRRLVFIGSTFGHSARFIRGIELFLDNLDSISLRTLMINFANGADEDIPVDKRLAIAVARFLRRSVAAESYMHAARRVDPDRYGAPNLRCLEAWNAWDEQCRRIISMGVLFGSETCYLPQISASAALGPVPSRLTELFLNAKHMGMGSSDDEEEESAPAEPLPLQVDEAFAIFDGAPAAPMLVPPQVLEQTWEEASHFAAAVNEVPQDRAHQTLKAQLYQNDRDLRELEYSAFKVLAAARVLACRVSGPLDPQRRCDWLNMLPPELRIQVLQHCDLDRRLSEKQLESVISFATDARTIGYGLNNELLLWKQRLRDETRGTLTRKPVLDLIVVKPWSWLASVGAAFPADYAPETVDYVRDSDREWPLHHYQDTGPKAAVAFLAITDCRRIQRVPSNSYKPQSLEALLLRGRDRLELPLTRLEYTTLVELDGLE